MKTPAEPPTYALPSAAIVTEDMASKNTPTIIIANLFMGATSRLN